MSKTFSNFNTPFDSVNWDKQNFSPLSDNIPINLSFLIGHFISFSSSIQFKYIFFILLSSLYSIKGSLLYKAFLNTKLYSLVESVILISCLSEYKKDKAVSNCSMFKSPIEDIFIL